MEAEDANFSGTGFPDETAGAAFEFGDDLVGFSQIQISRHRLILDKCFLSKNADGLGTRHYFGLQTEEFLKRIARPEFLVLELSIAEKDEGPAALDVIEQLFLNCFPEKNKG